MNNVKKLYAVRTKGDRDDFMMLYRDNCDLYFRENQDAKLQNNPKLFEHNIKWEGYNEYIYYNLHDANDYSQEEIEKIITRAWMEYCGFYTEYSIWETTEAIDIEEYYFEDDYEGEYVHEQYYQHIYDNEYGSHREFLINQGQFILENQNDFKMFLADEKSEELVEISDISRNPLNIIYDFQEEV